MSELKKCTTNMIDCFAYREGRCTCLADTRGYKCPFYKTRKQVLEENPWYYSDYEEKEDES